MPAMMVRQLDSPYERTVDYSVGCYIAIYTPFVNGGSLNARLPYLTKLLQSQLVKIIIDRPFAPCQLQPRLYQLF